METIWFCLVSAMIAMYVVFDGFDLGTGVLHLFLPRTEGERTKMLRSIGPVWDGNEVWLLAAGGTLYFAFPAVYARAFSGFYLPLMIVLWLLVLRAIGLELRGHLGDGLWRAFWDRTFGIASLLLAVFFGAALGNVVRGVPMQPDGHFFEPLWTHFGTTGETGILDWYTILVGVAALACLTLHGALWIVLKTDGALRDRARATALRLRVPLAVLVAGLTYATFRVQPHVPEQLYRRPYGLVLPLLAVAGWLGIRRATLRGAERRAFLWSCALIAGLLGSAVFGLYPYLLPAHTDPALGLSVHNSAAPDYGLGAGLVWWPLGMALVTGYFVYVYRRFAGKVTLDDEGY